MINQHILKPYGEDLKVCSHVLKTRIERNSGRSDEVIQRCDGRRGDERVLVKPTLRSDHSAAYFLPLLPHSRSFIRLSS